MLCKPLGRLEESKLRLAVVWINNENINYNLFLFLVERQEGKDWTCLQEQILAKET
jgi:hypothetical protein